MSVLAHCWSSAGNRTCDVVPVSRPTRTHAPASQIRRKHEALHQPRRVRGSDTHTRERATISTPVQSKYSTRPGVGPCLHPHCTECSPGRLWLGLPPDMSMIRHISHTCSTCSLCVTRQATSEEKATSGGGRPIELTGPRAPAHTHCINIRRRS